MRRFILLLSICLLAALGMAPVAHAAEPMTCIELVENDALHASGDGDQVPADAEKEYPHHHGGCHGHHVAPPLALSGAWPDRAIGARHRGWNATELAAASPDPTLRPPIA